MVPLESRRWREFKTYFGSPEELPDRLRRWLDAIGHEGEDASLQYLSEQFLHQSTITDAAYAVVPYFAGELERVAPAKRLDYLVKLGLIEAARQEGSAPSLPDDLTEDYFAAVELSRRHAVEALSFPLPKIEFRYLLASVSSLFGHGTLGDLVFHLDCLCGECPRCGASVYPDDIQDSGYC